MSAKKMSKRSASIKCPHDRSIVGGDHALVLRFSSRAAGEVRVELWPWDARELAVALIKATADARERAIVYDDRMKLEVAAAIGRPKVS